MAGQGICLHDPHRHRTGGYKPREDFQQLLARAGLRRIRWHDLRHACASLLARSGVQPKVVMGLLGHSDIKTTLQYYTHADGDQARLAVEAMDRALGWA